MELSFENVSYIYQQNTPFSHQALTDLSFTIPQGKYVAIIGHTGSGKSTVIQHLNGLVMPSKGTVRVGDYTMTAEKKPKDLKTLRSQVGVVFQYPEHQLFEETVRKDIAFGPLNFGVDETEASERVEAAAESVGLDKTLLERSPFELSGGQMRRVAIAGVLATRPRVLVLDEPAAGLDPRGQKEMMSMFSDLHESQALTTVLVTHNMTDAMLHADHLIILNDGKKYMEGDPVTIFSEREKLEDVNLDVPDIVQFMQIFSERFGIDLPFHKQSISELASEVAEILKGESFHE